MGSQSENTVLILEEKRMMIIHWEWFDLTVGQDFISGQERKGIRVQLVLPARLRII